jgi:hypothetical protein
MMTAVEACYCEDDFLEQLDVAINGDDADPKSITSLDLSGNRIDAQVCTDVSWKYISQCSSLTSMDLKANNIGPDGWSALYQALSSTCSGTLEELDISENGIFDEGLFQVAKLLVEAKRLRSLALVTNSLTPRGIPTLCDGLRHAHALQSLLIDYNNLGDAGACAIVEVVLALPNLTKLGLSDNSIGDAGAIAIANGLIAAHKKKSKGTGALLLTASNIEWLNLSCNAIGDAGFAALGEALCDVNGNAAIRNVDLSCNQQCGEAGRMKLATSSARWVALTSVELCSMNLSSASVLALTASVRSSKSSLRYVEYFNNPDVAPEAEAELAKAMDECDKPDRQPRGQGWCASKKAVVVGGCAVVGAIGVVLLFARFASNKNKK